MKSFKQYFFEAINGPKIIMIGGPGAGKSTYSEIITNISRNYFDKDYESPDLCRIRRINKILSDIEYETLDEVKLQVIKNEAKTTLVNFLEDSKDADYYEKPI